MTYCPTILLAGDVPTITDALTPFLERAGFHVLTAANGEDAFEVAQSHRPDLIVLNVLMPRLDGRELLRHAGRETPNILLTQDGNALERPLALEKSADDYLNKPSESHELLARIRAMLRRSQSGQASLSTAWILSLSFSSAIIRATSGTWW